jgi:hypothetical protein
VDECGSSAGTSVDAEFAEADTEPGRAERLSGLEAGEQPGGVGGGTDAGVGVDGVEEVADQPGERFGDGGGVGAEPQGEGAVVVVVDLVAGDQGDAGQRLGVEQDETAGDAVGELEGVVVEQPEDDVAAASGGVITRGLEATPATNRIGAVMREPALLRTLLGPRSTVMDVRPLSAAAFAHNDTVSGVAMRVAWPRSPRGGNGWPRGLCRQG